MKYFKYMGCISNLSTNVPTTRLAEYLTHKPCSLKKKNAYEGQIEQKHVRILLKNLNIS